MKRMVLIAAVALVVAACGGGSGGDLTESTDSTSGGTVTTEASSSEGTQPGPTTTLASDDGDNGGGDVEGAGVGTATIAGETYEFGDLGRPGLQCMPSSFGVAFLAALESTDGKGGGISVGIPFPGEEDTAGILPELEVTSDDLEWMANEERAAERGIPAGSSQVDSYEINGNTVSGTATFVEINSTFTGNADDIIVETGTFEVTCADG